MKLLFFTQESCSPCKRIKPIMREIAEEYDIDVDELDMSEHRKTASLFNIMSTPTIIVLDDDGLELRRVTGAKPKVDMVDALELAKTFDNSVEAEVADKVKGVVVSHQVKRDPRMRM